MITDADIGLDFGSLDLVGHDTTGAFHFNVSADGTDWGNPEQITREITSFLQDGAIKEVEGYDNRELTISVRVVAEDSYGLAAGEAALLGEVNKQRNTLTWTPPNKVTGSGAPCVFDVVSSSLAHSFDDLDELRAERAYTLTITALPFAHPISPVTVESPALPSTTPVVTTIDACTSTSGWAAIGEAGGGVGATDGVTAISGLVRSNYYNTANISGYRGLSLKRTGLSVNMSSAPYVRIDFSASFYNYTPSNISAPAEVYLNDVLVTASASDGDVGWYRSPSSTLTSVQVRKVAWLDPNGGAIGVAVRDISRTNMTTDVGGGSRQRSMTLPVLGSARAQGSITLSDPATALGSALVYSAPATGLAAQPSLRARLSSGPAATTDTGRISGKYSDLGTTHLFDIPVTNITPGTHALMAMVKAPTAGTFNIVWSAYSRMGTTTLDATPDGGTVPVVLAANVWTLVMIDTTTLPSYQLGRQGYARIGLSGPSGLLLDEAWVFNTDEGQLTWVDCGTGTVASGGPANRLYIDAASLSSPGRSVSLGTAADRSDAFAAASLMGSFGAHEVLPPGLNIFVVTSNSVSTSVALSYFPSYFTHVVDE